MPIELTEDEAALLAATDRFIDREMKPSIGTYVHEHQFLVPPPRPRSSRRSAEAGSWASPTIRRLTAADWEHAARHC